MKWLIMTGSGDYLRERFDGTMEQCEAYCKAHYLPNGYQIKEDN